MKKIIFILLLVCANDLAAQTSPSAAPEVGEGFTDSFMPLLEGHPALTHFLSLQSFNSSQVSREPWSDSYWPTYRGLIAARFADQRAPESKSWFNHHQFYVSHPSVNYVSSGHVSQLSPAEKYDLLIGDSNWTLTKHMWKRGQDAVDQFGHVPTWTGICHGWAAASQTHLITFTHFDIMALVSYLWAHAPGENHFVGRRCRTQNPVKDGNRIIEGACFDNNPMTWHLATVNRVGVMKKSFIMDTSNNSEVWNYVIDRYNVSYFNPATLEYSSVVEDSVIDIKDFPHDPYKLYRAPQAKYLVGVMMDIFHPGAVSPHSGVPSKQLLERKRFAYDLELDENMEVIGGEWHTKDHSDFLWIYPERYNPFFTLTDTVSLDPNPLAPPADVALAALARESSLKGRVLSEIVYKLLHRSLLNSP
jgi:hypothetical protein